MNLRKFPFDTQVLEAYLIAFGDNSREVLLEVDQRVLGATEEYATVRDKVNIAQWRLVNLDLIPFASSARYYADEEDISGIMLAVTMQRKPSYMIWKVLVPMVILVSLSNVDKDAMARRVDKTAKWLFPAVYFFGLTAIYLLYQI